MIYERYLDKAEKEETDGRLYAASFAWDRAYEAAERETPDNEKRLEMCFENSKRCMREYRYGNAA